MNGKKKRVAGHQKVRGSKALVAAESYYHLAREVARDGDKPLAAGELALMSLAGSMCVQVRRLENRAE